MSDDSTPIRGFLHAEYWIHCGECATSEYADGRTPAEAIAEAKSQGWTFTRKYGYRCPECSGTDQNQPDYMGQGI